MAFSALGTGQNTGSPVFDRRVANFVCLVEGAGQAQGVLRREAGKHHERDRRPHVSRGGLKDSFPFFIGP